MSVELLHIPDDKSPIATLELIHDLNFLKVRKRVESVFDECVVSGAQPGPGRSYYTDRFYRGEASQRFQYGFFKESIKEIERMNFDFQEEKVEGSVVRPKSEDLELLTVYDNFECVFTHTEKIFDDFWSFFCSDLFPLNLYNDDMSVSSAFRIAKDNLRGLSVGLDFLKDGELLNEILPPTPENQRRSNIYDTNADVVNGLSNLSCFFSNDFFELYEKEPLLIDDLIKVFAVYKSMLESFLLIFSNKDVFGTKEVPKFDQINPFVFFETFLTLTKHVAELRANSLVSLYIIRSFTT